MDSWRAAGGIMVDEVPPRACEWGEACPAPGKHAHECGEFPERFTYLLCGKHYDRALLGETPPAHRECMEQR